MLMVYRGIEEMKVLITGGNGFAGRCLSRYFVEQGHDVTATYRNNISESPIAGVKYKKQELSENISIEGDYDAIIHTAVSRSGVELDMVDYIRDNVDSAVNIVNYARNKGIHTIFYFSTRSVYGDIMVEEVDEDNDIINPGKYGQTKRLAEQIFSEARDLNTLGIRLPGVIGPGAHDIWLTDIVSKISNNVDVKISDYETKNLVYIYDIARFAEKMICLSDNGKYEYDIVNLCCKDTINNLEIVDRIKSRLKSSSRIIPQKPAKGLFRLNTKRAEKMGFQSLHPREIVEQYLDWYCNKEEVTI